MIPFVTILEAYWRHGRSHQWIHVAFLFVCFNYPAHTCSVFHWI